MRNKRFWEIDFIRGIAVILMIIFHIIFDLYYFLGLILIKNHLFWFLFPRVIATIFITISGVCLYISYERSRRKIGEKLLLKYLKRGLKIFSFGMIITFVSLFFIKEEAILFGILHFLGFSSIIAYPFLKLKKANIFISSIFIFLGIIFSNIKISYDPVQNFYLLILGLTPRNFVTLDYFPIFPWFGFILIGIFLGKTFYSDGERNFKIKDFSSFIIIKLISVLGRNSLKIYLLHQPIIILFIFLFIQFL